MHLLLWLFDVWCSYLFNLVSQFIGCRALQDQCCRIISALLKTFKSNPSKEIISVLGEQLQVCSFIDSICLSFLLHPHIFSPRAPPPSIPHFPPKKDPFQYSLLHSCCVLMQFLVSKLVACCIPTEAKGEQSGSRSSQVLSLLLELTVDSDPSLYDYIRVTFLTSQQWSFTS